MPAWQLEQGVIGARSRRYAASARLLSRPKSLTMPMTLIAMADARYEAAAPIGRLHRKAYQPQPHGAFNRLCQQASWR